MNRAPHAQSARGCRPRAGRVLLLGALALVGSALLTGAGGYLWYQSTAPRPPALDLEGKDPAIVAAVQEARTAVLQASRSARAWGQLGMVLAAHQFTAEANACFAQAERLNPKEPRWPYYQGVALSLGDPEAAIPKL